MTPEGPDEGGADLPPELRAILEQLGGVEVLRQMAAAGASGPVNWELARRGALQLAADGDRAPSPDEHARVDEALRLAEHWLDEGSLPASPDAGRLRVTSRQEWVNAAIDGIRPLVEPVARAQIGAIGTLMEDMEDAAGGEEARVLGLPAGLDLRAMRPVLTSLGAGLMGFQAGRVVGQLARQVFGQFDLGIPTADPAVAFHVAVNVADSFAGYDLDPTEVAVVLALREAAHRRQYHAVPWLAAHVRSLVTAFAEGTEIDLERLVDLSQEIMADVDPDDPGSMQAAMDRAAGFRLEPTAAQQRVLERLQGVVCLLQGWANVEVRAAAEARLPSLGRIEEVLRRRRATHGDGERQLADLLGLDLKPDDETVGDRFVTAVSEARGPAGLRRALAHPENLPDAEELRHPDRWLLRMAAGEAVPDDASSLFEDGDDGA